MLSTLEAVMHAVVMRVVAVAGLIGYPALVQAAPMALHGQAVAAPAIAKIR